MKHCVVFPTAPKIPPAEEVLSVNSTTATLFLDAWPVAGCPVTYFVVDFRTREADQRPGPWTLVANHAGPQQTVAVAGLLAASWYELRVTAHSDAGSTRHQFVFATRTKTGGELTVECCRVCASASRVATRSEPQSSRW